MAGLYAQRLAEKGYITIAADASYQGASEGTPRNVDKPQFRTEDIHGMADYISATPRRRQSHRRSGICGGGGYTLNAAKYRQTVQGSSHAEYVQFRAGEA